MNGLKNLFKKLLGEAFIASYHKALAVLANWIYGRPSEKLVVIGVTGTNGKSTTVNLIGRILEEAGHKVAFSSTVNFKIGQQERLNDLKMTMPGRFFLQKFLARALSAGCSHAVIEFTSQGILQHRHLGINYDVMVFTNLTAEHVEAHGGFENYKNAKLEYFRRLASLPRKIIHNQKIDKIAVANADDPHAVDFLNFLMDQKITFAKNRPADLKAEQSTARPDGIFFRVQGVDFNLKLKGIFDVYNALAAIAVAKSLGINLTVCKQALEKQEMVAGRMETIKGTNFQVLIDYAPEPESLRQMYATVKDWPKNRIIHVLGSTGGGRDKSRREILGTIAGSNAAVVVMTNEDPYDDDPMEIINGVAEGAIQSGKILDENLFKILDRRDAIKFALDQAKAGDLVIITGKGAEQKMAVKGGYIPWDDRKVVMEELKLRQS